MIEEELKVMIGADKLDDIQIIMKEILVLRQKYEEFLAQLKEFGLKDNWDFFRYHAIYTMDAFRNRCKNESDMKNRIAMYEDSVRDRNDRNEFLTFKSCVKYFTQNIKIEAKTLSF